MTQARQPAGRPTGGQFATTERAESPVALAPARPEGLAGWPETLPVPTVDVSWGDDGSLTTVLNVGVEEINVSYEDPHERVLASSFIGDGHKSWSEDEQYAALDWAEKFHSKFEEKIRLEAEKAAELARHRVAAEIMGASAPISTASLTTIHEEASEVSWKARRDAELAATSLLARRIHDRHPDAAYAELEPDYNEHGERYVSALVSYSADGEYLERVDCYGCVSDGEDDEGMDGYGDGDDEVSELMWYISIENVVTRLHHQAPAGREGRGYFIDLRKAADWAPGAEGPL